MSVTDTHERAFYDCSKPNDEPKVFLSHNAVEFRNKHRLNTTTFRIKQPVQS